MELLGINLQITGEFMRWMNKEGFGNDLVEIGRLLDQAGINSVEELSARLNCETCNPPKPRHVNRITNN